MKGSVCNLDHGKAVLEVIVIKIYFIIDYDHVQDYDI